MAGNAVDTTMFNQMSWQPRYTLNKDLQDKMASILTSTSSYMGSTNMPVFNYGGYSPMAFYNQTASATSRSSGTPETPQEYRKRMEEENNQVHKSETNPVSQQGNASGISMTSSEKSALIEQEKKNKEEEHKKEHKLGQSMAFGSVFMAGPVAKACYYDANKPATELLYAYDSTTKKAKYEALFKDNPLVMQNAQAELNTAGRKYQRALRKGQKPSKEDYRKLQKLMQDALDTGDAQKVAEATERLKAANKVRYKKLATQPKGSRTKLSIAKKADVTKAKAIKGNSFFKHLGGKSGMIMGIAAGVLNGALSISSVKEAYKIDKETGNKQLWQTLVKSTVPMAGYMGGDALGKWGATKLLSKSVSKLAAKVAARGAGKIVGAAIGSIIPGAGTVVGIILGTLIDFAVSKWVIPLISGGKHTTALETKQMESQSEEELFKTIALKKIQGENLTAMEQSILDKNTGAFENIVIQIQDQIQAQEMAQQEQATVRTA